MLLFKGFFVSLPLNKGLVNSNNFYYCRLGDASDTVFPG